MTTACFIEQVPAAGEEVGVCREGREMFNIMLGKVKIQGFMLRKGERSWFPMLFLWDCFLSLHFPAPCPEDPVGGTFMA